VQERDGDHRVALDQIDHQALLVEVAVQMLAQAVDPLAVVCLEALLDAVGAVAEWCGGARLRARRAGALVGEQFAARLGVQEAQRAVLVGLYGEAAVDEAATAVRLRGHGGGSACGGDVEGTGHDGEAFRAGGGQGWCAKAALPRGGGRVEKDIRAGRRKRCRASGCDVRPRRQLPNALVKAES
jgi:hypothetical protein